MSTGNRNEGLLDRSVVGSGESASPYRAAGFAGSAVLHGVVLVVLLAMAQHGMQTARSGLLYVPVEIARPSAASSGEQASAVPLRQEPAVNSASSPQQDAHGPSPAETLDAKLQTLAKLRQPDTATELGTSSSPTASINDDALPGHQALYNVRDFIRAQVERRWNFDLAALGGGQFSIPIHVEITAEGVVTKAELVDNAQSADPLYREIALSARNAVLLASPLSLPAGHYTEMMDMVLHLDTRDAVR